MVFKPLTAGFSANPKDSCIILKASKRIVGDTKPNSPVTIGGNPPCRNWIKSQLLPANRR